jgi:hypothetical protein
MCVAWQEACVSPHPYWVHPCGLLLFLLCAHLFPFSSLIFVAGGCGHRWAAVSGGGSGCQLGSSHELP